MANDWMSANAKCPYYYGFNGTEVHCAGVGKGRYDTRVFPNNKAARKYAEAYCCSIAGCKGCEYHGLLDLLSELGVLELPERKPKTTEEKVREGGIVQISLEDFLSEVEE